MNNFRKLVLASALVAGFAPAFAADQIVDLSSGKASFIGSAPLLDGGDDVISFINLAAGTYSFLFSFSSQNVAGLSADVNGQAATITPVGAVFTFASLAGIGNSPFTLTLKGTANGDSLYSGELAVKAVPEPETYALLLAGLGVLGFVARRRSA